MLSENITAARKAKGLSQEELASRLHVVRQTVSKWEKGRSVPDAGLLLALSEELNVSVSDLLGEAMAQPEGTELDRLAKELERINALLAERAARNRRIAFRIGLVLVAVTAVSLAVSLFLELPFFLLMAGENVSHIGGADGPTSFEISRKLNLPGIFLSLAALAAGVVLLIKNKR